VRKRVLFAALLAGVCSLGVAACGGSSDDTTTTAAPAASSAAAPATTEAPAASTAAATTEAASTAAAAGDAAAGKAVFTSNCGSCHTLADAGTTGAVGPNLDDLKPDAARVQHQVEVGGGPMPAFKGTLSDTDIANVAAYVSSVAGQ
jgi:mono/diheme cytochrome c family protein